jgi:arsenate reductase
VITIWHNPRCSKSRQTLALLQERGTEPEIRHYLTDSPSAGDIRRALTLLAIPAAGLVRFGEKTAKELKLTKTSNESDLIDAMVSHPILIERPVVFANGKAALGRPPEAVLDIL